MSKEDEELERLKKLRAQQIAARDPTVKEKKLYRQISENAKNKTKYTLKDAINDMPAKWFYMLIGTIVGIFIGIALMWIINAWWSGGAALIVTLVCALLGRVVGLAEDFRKE